MTTVSDAFLRSLVSLRVSTLSVGIVILSRSDSVSPISCCTSPLSVHPLSEFRDRREEGEASVGHLEERRIVSRGDNDAIVPLGDGGLVELFLKSMELRRREAQPTDPEQLLLRMDGSGLGAALALLGGS